MQVRCQRCGHVNDQLGSTRFCEVCNAPLPASQPAPLVTSPPQPSPLLQPQADTPPPTAPTPVQPSPLPAGEKEGAPATAPAPSGERRKYRRLTFTPRPVEEIERPVPSEPFQPTAPRRGRPPVSPLLPAQPVPMAAATPPRPDELVGAIIDVRELQAEPPDADIARILFSILLIADLIFILGWFALVLIVAFIIVMVIGALLRMMWLTAIFGFLVQTVFYVLSPVLGGLMQGRDNRQLQPVANYIVRTDSGKAYTFRIKGQLRGATPNKGDRVRVWGRPWHGILRLEGGEKLDTGEPLLLPVNWSWLWLILLLIANLIGYFILSGNLRF